MSASRWPPAGAWASAAIGLATLCAVSPAVAQRAPVLQQVKVRHPYYYREMFIPQVTSGPGAVAWSPDGTELVYAMQGSLWRQRVGSTEARQLTDGPGYDYEPDWSPDGNRIVYASRAVYPVLDLYPYATTSPVYVSVAGRPARSAEDAAYFLRWIARIEAIVRGSRDWNADAERAGALGRIDQARRQFEQRRAEAAAWDAGR